MLVKRQGKHSTGEARQGNVMDQLQTRCRHCESPFETAKKVAKAMWWMEAWSARREQCPNCREWRTYSKSEFFFA